MENGKLTFKKENLLERVLNFGVRIIKLVNKLPKTPAGFKVGSQLVGSATSIGANTEEAQDASSKPDFISKMSIALREAKESKFWLKLIKKSELLLVEQVDPELKEVDELCAIYSTIVKKAKLNLSNVKSQMSNVSGFTLIELLITISIVAVLSTVGLIVFQGIQSKARDSIRKNDLSKLAAALEIYYQQNYKYIVNTDGTDLGSCDSSLTSTFYNGIASSMSNGVPDDPLTHQAYCYISLSAGSPPKAGQSFRLFAKMENANNANLTGCVSSSYNYSAVSDNTSLACPP